MNVLMLIPPQPRSKPGRWFLREERHAAVDNTPCGPYMAPSIMGMVAARNPGVTLRVLDLMTERWGADRIQDEVARIAPDLVIAVLAANHLGDPEERLCAELSYPTIAVLTPVGASVQEAVAMYGLKSRAFVSHDEVEVIVAEAVREFAETGTVARTKGVVVNDGGQLRFTGVPPYSDMTKYPLPAFDLFPWERYNELQEQVTRLRPVYDRTAIMNGMKGCPFHCNFCIVGGEAAKARTKTGEQLFQEVRHLYERHGRRRFNFMDSEFGANKKSAADFCRLVIEHGLEIRFDVKNRIEFLNEDLLDLMKRAGCERMFYGIETADPRLQKAINKNLDLAQGRHAIEVTKRHGIQVYLFMMVGIMGETRESLDLDARFIAETKPHGISWGILFPEVGSPWYDQLKATGQLVEQDWNAYRQFDRITFKHDVYRSMEEIHRAQLWMRNRYRRYLALDRSLPPKTRLAYAARYALGAAKHSAWTAFGSLGPLAGWNVTLGLKFDAWLERVTGARVL